MHVIYDIKISKGKIGICAYLAVHLRQQLQQLLLRMYGESCESPNVDEGPDVGVDQNRTWRLEVHIHAVSTPLHRSWNEKTNPLGKCYLT